MRVTSTVRLIVVGSLLVAVAAVAAVASEGSRAFRIRDDCDPATFNAAIGAGTCKVTFDGDTTGEFHTFTRVADFGGGIVPVLNTLAEAGATRPECGTPGVLAPPTTTNNFVPSGAAFPGPTAGSADLPKGTTKWQCCIHPWMRATITVK